MSGKRNLVSLCPSMTETLVDFGLGEQLVGITRYCIHPADVVKELPKVGGTKNPDIDAIRSAKPDLIFVNAEENRREDYEVLAREFDVDVSMPKRVADVPSELRRHGRLLGCGSVAEARAAELERALDELDGARFPFTFAYMIWKKPWMTVGNDTYVSDLVGRGGGVNVYQDADARYPETTLERLAEKRPDVVLLPDEPYPFGEGHAEELRTILPSSVDLISGDDCCWHGVRSIRGARTIANLARRMQARLT